MLGHKDNFCNIIQTLKLLSKNNKGLLQWLQQQKSLINQPQCTKENAGNIIVVTVMKFVKTLIFVTGLASLLL